MKIYEMSSKKRRELGLKGEAHVKENYNFAKYCSNWDNLLKDVHKKHGSWENRKNYKTWEFSEV